MGTPISGYGPPTTKTRAQVGDFYIDQDSQKVYKCTAINPGSVLDYGFIDIHQGHDNEYEWIELFGDTIPITNAAEFHYAGLRLDLLGFTDTSKSPSFNAMFSYCSKLTSIPEIDTRNGTDFRQMFYSCSKLTSIPEIDTRNGTDFYAMFQRCSALVSVPKLNTSKGITFHQMFEDCSSLMSIPELDINNGTDVYALFQFCSALTDLYIHNIRISLQIGSGTTWGHLLTVDSLVHTIKELCKVTTQQTLTMGSANLAKIATLYCKVTDDTTEKIDMELCESTDEGAITLSDYALMKNWLIK